MLSGLNFIREYAGLFRIHFSKSDCVFFKGEEGKLGDFIGASGIRLLAVLMCILLMTLLANDRELLIITIHPLK